ncbi:hypothetical protein BYT27DRAFT_7199856 [Phlegmacium glaucopus]|nr:hypothetical protein BYT27DRAFT_7199856 [Phlegmacium glaucopus]
MNPSHFWLPFQAFPLPSPSPFMGHQYYHHHPNHYYYPHHPNHPHLPNHYHYHHHPNHPHNHSIVGPTHNQRYGGHRMTVASTPYNMSHILSRTTASSHSMGTYPVYAGMGALNNTGVGGATPPSGNPQMGSVKPKRAKRHHSGPPKAQKQQRGREDLSAYLVPVVEITTAGGSAVPTVIPAPAPAPTSAVLVQPATSTSGASTPAAPTASPATAGHMRRRGHGGNIKTKAQKSKVYDDNSDVHRVSSGSESD